jgi:hypothetical protein
MVITERHHWSKAAGFCRLYGQGGVEQLGRRAHALQHVVGLELDEILGSQLFT